MSAQDIVHAIGCVRPALANKDIVPYQKFFLLKDRRLHAQNGWAYASAQCPVDGEFLVSGEEFERAVDRLPRDKLAIEYDDNEQTVTVKSGRLRTKIETLPIDDFPTDTSILNDPGGIVHVVDNDALRHAIKELRPFISENATRPFATCLWFSKGRVQATNNITLVECSNSGLPGNLEFLMPHWGADFILGMNKEIVQTCLGPGAVSFEWEDGTRMRSSLSSAKWPLQASELIDQIEDVKHEISDDWRSSVLALFEFGESEMTIHADHITVGRGRSSTRLDISTPMPVAQSFTKWALPFIEPVIRRATHIDFTKYPRPMYFKWGNVKGLSASRR